jgi:hypothetical protein
MHELLPRAPPYRCSPGSTSSAVVGGVALFGSDGFPQFDTSLDEVVGGRVDPKLVTAGDLDRSQPGDPTRPPVAIRTGDERFPIPGTVVVQSYRDVYTDYRQHPETKAATAIGDPVLPGTRGLLAPATITATGVDRIGKEANRLTEDDLADGDDDEPVLYTARTCRGCDAPVVGRRQWCSDACRKRATRRTRSQNQVRQSQRGKAQA